MSRPKFVVMTDSACDLPVEMAQKAGVYILNFTITLDGQEYEERRDFTPDEYYGMLRTCEGIPTTAKITHLRFLEEFEAQAANGVKELLYVSICGRGSGTNEAAHMAKEKFDKKHGGDMAIYIVDSNAYSMGYGWPVVEAARKLNNGALMSEVVEYLENWFARCDIVLGAYSLRFIKKSGRVSAAAAFAGELLGLRPIISLTDGVSRVQKKVRGDKDVIPTLVQYAEEHMDDTCTYMVVGADAARMDEMAALCTKRFKQKPLGCFKAGAAVSTNTGPDLVALIFLGEPRR